MSQNLDVRAATDAGSRMADALLRAVGGSIVMLRIPGNATPEQDAEELGLNDPAFDEVAIGPAVFRRVTSTKADGKGERAELLVSATTIQAIVGSLGFASGSALFAQAAGVVANGALLQIIGVTSSEIFGRTYLYRLQLRGALSGAV